MIKGDRIKLVKKMGVFDNIGEICEVTDIFPTTSKMVKSNRYPYKDIEEKHMIPVTIEKIFEVMKPMYIQKYLANGREYEKEYEFNE